MPSSVNKVRALARSCLNLREGRVHVAGGRCRGSTLGQAVQVCQTIQDHPLVCLGRNQMVNVTYQRLNRRSRWGDGGPCLRRSCPGSPRRLPPGRPADELIDEVEVPADLLKHR